jgi:ABC-2 type transport system permease protein
MQMSASMIARAYLRETWFECLRVLRTPGFSIPILVLPVGFYLLLGVVMAKGRADAAGGGPGNLYWFTSFAVYGVLAPGLIGISSLLASDRSQGILEYKRAVPMPYAAYVVSKLFMAIILSMVVTALIGVLAAAVGGVSLSLGEFLGVAGIVVLGVAPVSALGLSIASYASASGSSAIAGTLLVLMAILAGLFYPLPSTLDALRAIWPTYHLQQLALASVDEPSVGSTVEHVSVLLGMTAVFAVLAARRLARPT